MPNWTTLQLTFPRFDRRKSDDGILPACSDEGTGAPTAIKMPHRALSSLSLLWSIDDPDAAPIPPLLRISNHGRLESSP